jgi:alpha-tubulin suppressor-like RCC1 family protein
MTTRSVLCAVLLVSLLGCGDEAKSPLAPTSELALATTAAALAFAGMSAGQARSCGVTTDSRAYCWGWNQKGQLGDGTTTDRVRPTVVAGGLRFRQLSVGGFATCGITTDYLAYCWGDNGRGELGDGTTTQRLVPVRVVGGHKFSQISTNSTFTCAVGYPDGKGYCWGYNGEGQLGIGSNDVSLHSRPLAVAGGLTFQRLTTGTSHTCGVSTNNRVYCWGSNDKGQLGDGTEIRRRTTPRLVTGMLKFAWVDAGDRTTCGVTTDSRAYCWGYGKNGQRGDGSVTEQVRSPRAVFGNHLFLRVVQSGSHACGVTPSSQAWCWGRNYNGQLGDGTTTARLTPHLVAGGLAFGQVDVGGAHTCGRTTAGVAYCWGENSDGELGDGTNVGPELCPFDVPCSLKPDPVVGPI